MTRIYPVSGNFLMSYSPQVQIVLSRQELKFKGAISSWIQKTSLKKILSVDPEDRKEVIGSFCQLCTQYKVSDIISRSKATMMLEELVRSSKEFRSSPEELETLLQQIGDELQKRQLVDSNNWAQITVAETASELEELLSRFDEETALLKKRIRESIDFYNSLVRNIDKMSKFLSENESDQDRRKGEIVLGQLRSIARNVINELCVHREALDEITEGSEWAQLKLKDHCG